MNMIYAIKDGKKVHVDKVINGKDCMCNCEFCGQRVIAKNKSKNQKHYFAHFPCTRVYEKNGNRYVKDGMGNEQLLLDI